MSYHYPLYSSLCTSGLLISVVVSFSLSSGGFNMDSVASAEKVRFSTSSKAILGAVHLFSIGKEETCSI